MKQVMVMVMVVAVAVMRIESECVGPCFSKCVRDVFVFHQNTIQSLCTGVRYPRQPCCKQQTTSLKYDLRKKRPRLCTVARLLGSVNCYATSCDKFVVE